MKLNKYSAFTYIWLVHMFVYYLTFTSIYKIMNNNYHDFYKVIFGFLGGIIGFPLKQIPFFFIIPLVLMAILVKTKLHNKWFIAYTISICFTYLAIYLWVFFDYKRGIMLGYPKEFNTIYLIIPSLIVSIICNWFIFKKFYKKLEQS